MTSAQAARPATDSADQVLAHDLMSSPVRVVQSYQNVWEAWSIMLQTRLRHLVVCEGLRCVGVVDDRELFAHWPVGPYGVTATPVRDLVRRRTSCVLPDAPVRHVARLMIDEGVDVVPVTARDGSLIGVITGSDVVRAVAANGLRLPSRPVGTNGPEPLDAQAEG